MNKLLKFTFFLLLLAAGSPVFSQTSLTSPGKHFLFKNYTTQNGLLEDYTMAMAQDKYGYLWIGSESGLTRFDGKTFYHKAIPEIFDNTSRVKYLEISKSGNIISSSFMQGVFVKQENGQFKKYGIGK